MSETDQEIAESVLPIAVGDLAVPTELNEISAWHRPRKHYIRKHQWLRLTENLIDHQKGTPALPQLPGGTYELRYLTLPGSDMIDVELMGELARKKGANLTSVGFLAGSETNPSTARAEIRREALIESGKISDRSYTLSRRIEEITGKGSPTYREFKSRGPYHAINLDACGSVAPPDSFGNESIVQVIHTIMEYQFAHFSGRWLLFLTCDVRQEQFDQETMERLLFAIRSNAEAHQGFRDRTVELINRDCEDLREALRAHAASSEAAFLEMFCIGVGKWMLGLAREAGWDLKMHPAFCYSTTPEGDGRLTMPCLAFEFRPPLGGLEDPAGIGNPLPHGQPPYEERAMSVLSRVSQIEDLDTRMAANDAERKALVEETREILRRIGYTDEAISQVA